MCTLPFYSEEKDENEGCSKSLGVQTRSSQSIVDLKEATCDEPAGSADLHNASTYDIDKKVRQCVLELEDTALLAKLAPGDMIALEAKYHGRCLAAQDQWPSESQWCQEVAVHTEVQEPGKHTTSTKAAH